MFEWDPAKNEADIAKHGVSFEIPAGIFEGPVLTMATVRNGEARSVSIGAIGPLSCWRWSTPTGRA
jgi:hypothetical protein